MASDRSSQGVTSLLRLGRGERFSVIERVIVLVVIGFLVLFDIVGLFSAPLGELGNALVSILSTAALALFVWSPLAAVVTLAAMFGVSFLVGTELQVLTTAAVATGMVLRLGSTPLVYSYLGGFLLASAVMAYDETGVPVNVGLYLIFATVAGAIGFGLRLAFARGHRLETQLAASAEQERQAVLAERRWIAGELHDSIAHHLTVVSLHVQLIDDPQLLPESQEAIRVAARKAMTDLRFVIELADDGPRSSGMQTGDLSAAMQEARSEFEAAWHSVAIEGEPGDPRIPRSAEIILARIVRESATNVLKYAGPGLVEMTLRIDDESADLTITSPLPSTPRRDLPSSGTGIGRMAERVLGASGRFDAGESEGKWRVSARLPIARPVA